MIYSVFNSNLLLIWGCNLAISKASLILRLPNLHFYIGLISRVFASGQWDWDSIPSRVIPKTQKRVLDAALLNTQHYKVRIKGKVEQFREQNSPLPYTLV